MQLVGYEPTARGSSLLVSENGAVRRRPLEIGETLRYRLGPRHCAGVIDDEGHQPCDRSNAPYCADHESTWICARCTGTCLKDEMDCYEEHAVYLAAFAPDTFKVGVTRSWRLETRLREQGADRGAHLHTVSNGRIARELESELVERFTDRVRIDTKRESLGSTLDETAWSTVLEEFDVIDRFTFDYGFECPTRPVPETMAAGTIYGIKGRLLILERAGTSYAIDLRDLVGYEVEELPEHGREKRRLQSSLGSFED